MACTRVVERVEAAVGDLQQASTQFDGALDVPNGGVILALPALLENGLLRHSDSYFKLPAGYYGVIHIFVVLAYMALSRIRTCEQLRYAPCGEWGKLVGLDRIPEVRTLRGKIKLLSDPEAVRQWSAALSQEWMRDMPEAAGVLYVDGHVRVYHGSQTKLPRRYVSRQRLCMRGMTDYWVNDNMGRPFFAITTPFSDGLLATLQEDIVPRLLKEVPNQPSEHELAQNLLLARFTLVFDREGYSPAFFKEMWKQRIACVSYHKHPKGQWPEEQFQERIVILPHAGQVSMKLCERGTLLGADLWVREIRKLTDTGHQTSVITTDYQSSDLQTAAHMFSRWSQENFFRYMIEHFDLDGLAGYCGEAADETKKVVDPKWRTLDGQVRTLVAKLARKLAKLGADIVTEVAGQPMTAAYELRQGKLKEEIDLMQKDVQQLKDQRKQTPKHIELGKLPEEQRFKILAPTRKQFTDTIRMIAYRAETAMAVIMREKLARSDDARSLLREIFTTSADLFPDTQAKTLTVQLHNLTNKLSDDATRHLMQELNASQTLYPGTNLRLFFKLVSDPNPPDQEF